MTKRSGIIGYLKIYAVLTMMLGGLYTLTHYGLEFQQFIDNLVRQ